MLAGLTVAAAFAVELDVQEVSSIDACGDRVAVGSWDGTTRVYGPDGALLATSRDGNDVDLGDGGRLLLARDWRRATIREVGGGVVARVKPPGGWSAGVALAEDSPGWLYVDGENVREASATGTSYLGPGWADFELMGRVGDLTWWPDGRILTVQVAGEKRNVPLPADPSRIRLGGGLLFVSTYSGFAVVDPKVGSATPEPAPGLSPGQPFVVGADGRLLIYAVEGWSYGSVVVAWDREARRIVAATSTGTDALVDLALLADGSAVLATRERVWTWKPEGGEVEAATVALGFDDGDAWSVTADGLTRVWGKDGTLLSEVWLPIPGRPVVTTGPGELLWVDGSGRILRGDVRTGVVTEGPKADSPQVLAIADDGAIGAASPGSLRTWDAAGQPVLDVQQGPYATSIAVAPGGREVVAAHERTLSLYTADAVRWSVPLDGDALALAFVGNDVLALTSSKDIVRIGGASGEKKGRYVSLGRPWSYAALGGGGAVAIDEEDAIWRLDGDPQRGWGRQRALGMDADTRAVAVDGDQVLVVSHGALQHIDMGTGASRVLAGRAEATAIAVAGDTVLVGWSDGSLRTYERGQETKANAWRGEIGAIDLTAEGARAAGTTDGTVALIAPAPRPERGVIAGGEGRPGVSEIAWSPDGKHVIVATVDWSVQIYDAELRPVGEPLSTVSAAWLPDGRAVAVDGWDGLLVWEGAEWRQQPTKRKVSHDLGDRVVACGDGSFVGSPGIGSKGSGWRWSSVEAKPERLPLAHGYGYQLACSGEDVVVGGWDGLLTVLPSGVELAHPEGHRVLTTAWMPDRRLLVSYAGGDLLVWDVTQGTSSTFPTNPPSPNGGVP